MSNEKYAEDKARQETKINDMLYKFKDFESKNNPGPLLERQNNFINNLDNKIINMERDMVYFSIILNFNFFSIVVEENIRSYGQFSTNGREI